MARRRSERGFRYELRADDRVVFGNTSDHRSAEEEASYQVRRIVNSLFSFNGRGGIYMIGSLVDYTSRVVSVWVA